MSFKIIFYEKENKEIPFLSFLNSLPEKLSAKVVRDMELLKEYGNKLGEPFSSPLGKGIFELRTKQGSNITRSIYFFECNEQIIVTHGFVKKTNKTPPREIAKAIKYRIDWEKRNK